MRERAEAILPETTLTRTRGPVSYAEDQIQTIIVAELVQPPAPIPAVVDTQTQKADDPFIREEEWSQAKAKAIILEQRSDTLRRGAIALGIAGIAWGALAGMIGLKPMIITTTIALLLASFALIYRACFQEVPIEEID